MQGEQLEKPLANGDIAILLFNRLNQVGRYSYSSTSPAACPVSVPHCMYLVPVDQHSRQYPTG